MAMLTTLVVSLILFAVGRALVHFIGLPRSLADGAKWSAILFAFSIFATAIPQVTVAVESRLGALPSIGAGEFIAVLVIIGLGVLGYVVWRNGENDARPETRLQVRRRALPPPPARHGVDRQFTLLNDEDGDE